MTIQDLAKDCVKDDKARFSKTDIIFEYPTIVAWERFSQAFAATPENMAAFERSYHQAAKP